MKHGVTLRLVVVAAVGLLPGCADRSPTRPAQSTTRILQATATTSCTVLESETWWSATPSIPLGGRSEHAHNEVCFPYMQVLSGSYTFNVTSKMHNVPSWVLHRVNVYAASQQYGVILLGYVAPNTVCSTGDCAFSNAITVNLSSLAPGTWEFRIQTVLDPTPTAQKRIMSTNGWLACVGSCSGVTPQATPVPFTDARGWYRDSTGTVFGYLVARFAQALPSAPVSGTWCPHVRTEQGAGSTPVTHSYVSIDPAFHAVPEDSGIVVLDTAGTFNGQRCINTTTLANGTHHLFIRADYIPGTTGPFAGAQVIPFTVQN